ncbi:MAG: alpha/beta hydrolase [Betaproteobacteria bacterium 13_1_40CM_4_64_4]|nr:MAG: alpha/beta hydrolase [Betaproteobacteria bacterium 13_1_40CM_4_64_4]
MANRTSGRFRAYALRLFTGSAAVALLVIAGCGQLAEKERELTFRVVPGTASWFDGLPQGVEETDLAIEANGKPQRIHAWWWPAATQHAPAILYLHGSRWNLTGQANRIEQLHAFGFSVLAIDYRGFGKSDGDLPSEETVYEDSRAAWDRLAQLQPDASLRFIYGHSLGGAVAVDLAAHLSAGSERAGWKPPARGVIVESSFTTLPDIARALSYPWLPVQLLMTQKFDSVHKIAALHMPVLIVHGAGDGFVPARFSEELYEAAPEPKKLLLVNGATHNNSMRVGTAEYLQAMHELFGFERTHTAAAIKSRDALSLSFED